MAADGARTWILTGLPETCAATRASLLDRVRAAAGVSA
jgi:hypothetical protein